MINKYIMMVALVGLVGCGGPDQIDPCDAGPEWAHLCGTGGAGGEGGAGVGGETGTGGVAGTAGVVECGPETHCYPLSDYAVEQVSMFCHDPDDLLVPFTDQVVETCSFDELCVSGPGHSASCESCGLLATRQTSMTLEGPDGGTWGCEGCACEPWNSRCEYNPTSTTQRLQVYAKFYPYEIAELVPAYITGKVYFQVRMAPNGEITIRDCQYCTGMSVSVSYLDLTETYSNGGTTVSYEVSYEFVVSTTLTTELGSVFRVTGTVVDTCAGVYL